MIGTEITGIQLANSQTGLATQRRASQVPLLQNSKPSEQQDGQAKKVFSEFVAGTFYQQMLKALRSSENEIAYIGGGQAEKLFRGQLDMQIASDLANSHDDTLSQSLYESFSSRFDHSA